MAQLEELKTVKLTGNENYQIWKFQIGIILKSMKNGDLLNTEKPSDAAKLKDWTHVENSAQRIIVTSVSEKVLSLLFACDSSKTMLEKLDAVYGHKSDASLHTLQQKFYGATYNKEDGIGGHISKLEHLVSQMKNLGETVSQGMLVAKILNTLPPEFSHFHSAWDSTPKGEQTLSNLTARLLIEEERLKNKNPEQKSENKEENTALINQKRENRFQKNEKWNQKNDFKSENIKKCYFCGKLGHLQMNCRFKQGVKCYNCNKVGHLKKDCKFKKENSKFLAALSSYSGNINKETWVCDSGASQHMTCNKEYLENYTPFSEEKNITIGDGSIIKAYGEGSVQILNERKETVLLREVLYVPKLVANLFSPKKGNCLVILNGDKCTVYKKGIKVFTGRAYGKLYELHAKAKKVQTETANITSLQLWHERLGHQNKNHVKRILKNFGIAVNKNEEEFCEPCVFGKQCRKPFPTTNTKTTEPGQIIHSDVCGPMEEPSIGGSRYFVLFKDDFSHYRRVYFLKQKNEVKDVLRDFIQSVKTDTGKKVKILRTDRGKEDCNQYIQEILKRYGIRHQTTVGYAPEQNGSAERDLRTITEGARTLRCSKRLPKRFWAEAVNTMVYILNKTGTSSIPDKTPYELWFGNKPTIEELKVFGSEVYCHIPKQKRRKWDEKSKKGIFVGYDENVKGYRIYFRNTNKTELHRDVIFREENQESKIQVPIEKDTESEKEKEIEETEKEIIEENVEDSEKGSTDSEGETSPSKRELRDRTTLKKPARYVSNVVAWALVAGSEPLEPTTYEEAIENENNDQWKKAMDKEMDSLKNHKVWDLCKLPADRKALKNKWVYRIKRNEHGQIERFKARLVCCGYSQQYGIDYTETYSPVAKYTSIRTILALAVKRKMKLKQFDVITAYLYGNLEEEIYMAQPKGYEDGTDRVCKLKQSIYGLKQSGKMWNQRFTEFLRKFELTQSKADACVFTNKNHSLIIAIYVDDGLIAAENQKELDMLLKELNKTFKISSSPLHYYLGMEINVLKNGSIFIHQKNYIEKVLKRFKCDDSNPVSIPINGNESLNEKDHPPNLRNVKDEVPYREAVGSLMFLAVISRPDISYAVSRVSQYLENPKTIHWNAVKKILKYLQGTVEYGLFYQPEGNLEGYSDADFAGDTQDRKSTSGYVFQFCGTAISWASQKQRLVVLSTTEAEFVAASEASREAIWLRNLFLDLTGEEQTIPLYVDNKSTICVLKNEITSKRSKHYDIRYYYVKDLIKEKIIAVMYVNTKNQKADIFTKGLNRDNFVRLRNNLGLTKI